MPFDIVLAVGALIFAVLGYFSGALRQLSRIAALILAYALARLIGLLAAEPLAQQLGWSLITARIFLTIVAWIASFVILLLAARAIIKAITGEHETAKSFDAFFGAGLGVIKYGLVAFLFMGFLAAIAGDREEHPLNRYLAFNQSIVGQLALRHNLLLMLTSDEGGKIFEAIRGIDALVNSAAQQMAADMDLKLPDEPGKKDRLSRLLVKSAVGSKESGEQGLPEDLLKSEEYRKLILGRLRAGAAVQGVAGKGEGQPGDRFSQLLNKPAAEGGTNPESRKRLDEMFQNEKVRKVLENTELLQAIQSGRIFEAIANPDFQSLFQDPQAVSELSAIGSQRMLGGGIQQQ